MYRGQIGRLLGVIEASQLVIPQYKVPVVPFHIGAGTLEHLRERLGLVPELVLLCRAQRPQGPTGLKQWGCGGARQAREAARLRSLPASRPRAQDRRME
jgi:hypothetical protein